MKTKLAASFLGVIAWAVTVTIRLGAGGSLVQTPGPQPIDYERQVRPTLAARCLECHSQDKRKGGLSLTNYADALDGGRSGAAIRPGNAGKSLLLRRISGEIAPQMPLGQSPLGDGEIALIRQWIDQGARPTPTSPPAPPPWEAPLALTRPDVPERVWALWRDPVDRFVAAYLSRQGMAEPALISDGVFARRVFLDVWGLPPPPDVLQTFLRDRTLDKRTRLIATLLADNDSYAEHWISFWNDLLRNEDGVSYFSETARRKSMTEWLLSSLVANVPYDQIVSKLLNPAAPGDPDGFLIGVNWRGETSAAVTPWMQASQNTAQVFLGVNLKCNACHDSFISRWKLKDAYGLAAYFSPEPKLQIFRCDVARDQYAEPAFLYPELAREPASSSLRDRRAAAAGIFTDPRNGRLPRTIVNRVWQRLFGHGIVPNSDEMDGRPWNPELLDWVASDFVQHRYDLKHLIATLLSSRAYQMKSVSRPGEPPERGYMFGGPELRRMTAEQFIDAIGSMTGEWSVYQPPAHNGAAAAGGATRGPVDSDPVSAGRYGRAWRAPSNNLSRALGRPIRDQVTSVRANQGTTLQALELVNGDTLTRWLQRGALRLLGQLPPEPRSLFNKALGGRSVVTKSFDIDVSHAATLWLIVDDTGSNAPERVEPVWVQATFVGAAGSTPLSSLQPLDRAGLRSRPEPITLSEARTTGVRVTNPSRLAYDIAGRGFTRFRATIGIENPGSEIGSTLNPQLRFFIFDVEPNMERLLPPEPGPPAPAGTGLRTPGEIVDRVFSSALGRAPSAAERREAMMALHDPGRADRPSADGLADLLWAILMKPEFQFIY
jgi:hypothetical protein